MWCRQWFKEACRLHKALAPSAAVHKTRNVNGLEQLALETESLAEQVENTAQQAEPYLWTADLDLFKLLRDGGLLVRAGQQW